MPDAFQVNDTVMWIDLDTLDEYGPYTVIEVREDFVRLRDWKTTAISHGDLMRYADASYIGDATEQEQRDSREAAEFDGGAGVIRVEIGGEMVDCYVEDDLDATTDALPNELRKI